MRFYEHYALILVLGGKLLNFASKNKKNDRVGFSLVGFVLALLVAFSGLIAVNVVSPKGSANAAGNVACSKDMDAQGAGYKATPSHGKVFYIDSGLTPKIDASYVGYTITNTTGSTQSFWVSVNNFIGGKVTLANPADEYQQITDLATGSSKTVFYLLKASAATTAQQTHTVKVWNQRPDLFGATASLTCDFTFLSVKESIKASSNKIGDVTATATPSTPTLGGTVAISLSTNGNNKTQTGNLGAGSAPDYSAFWASPTAYSTWPTQALRLESTTISISCGGSTYLVLTNRLFVSDTSAPVPAGQTALNTCVSTGAGSLWTATYTFRIIGPAPGTITPSPIAIISSGTQYKHSTFASGTVNTLNLSGVSAADAMKVELSAAKDTTTTTPAVPAGAVRIKYTATVSTTSTSALQVDELVDTHASLASPGGYVAGSTTSQLGTTTVKTGPEPNVLAAERTQTPPPQHFVGPFTGITASASQKLIYSFDIPCDGLPHSTSIMAFVGDTGIGVSAIESRSITVTQTAANCSGTPTITSGVVSLDPTATTTAATNVNSATAATLNGVLNASGNSGTSYRFIYDTDKTLATATASWINISGSPSTNTAYSLGLTGLSPQTTYYFRIQIRNSSGTIFSGVILSFTTLAQQAIPTVETASATKVQMSGATYNATLNGMFNPNLTQVDTVKFQLCTNAAMTTCVGSSPYSVFTTGSDAQGNPVSLVLSSADATLAPSLASSGEFAVNSDSYLGAQLVTGLAGATDYYFRLYVTCVSNATYCPGGQVNGSVVKFTTGAPAATTLEASNVGGTTATLNGTVNANNTTNSLVSFCYSSSSTATNGALNTCDVGAASPATASGGADQAETAAVTGLTQGTTYYFQVKIAAPSPSTVVTYGAILEFTTLKITTASLANGATGVPYSASLAGMGGSNTFNFSTASTLPPGMELTPEGLLAGTPTSSGTYTLNIVMTDPLSGQSVTKQFSITITGDPTVAATGASSVRFTTASINGTVSPNGTAVTGASFCWGTDSSLNTCATITIAHAGFNSMTANAVSSNLTGLTANTDYYYKVTTTWSGGSASTAPTLFKTASVSTTDPSSVGLNGATVGGIFVAGSASLSNSDVSEAKTCYSKSNTTASGILSSNVSCTTNQWTGTLAGLGSANYSKILSGLEANTLYYFQQQVTFNGGDLSYGAVKSFTTLDLPTATVDSPLQVTGKSAKIRGKVNPRGNSVNKVTFCWSTSPTISVASCVAETDMATSFITNNGADNNTETLLSNLAPGTTYYYLIYAKTSNFVTGARVRSASVAAYSYIAANDKVSTRRTAVASSDTVSSNTSSFTTAGAVTDAASSVTGTTATLNGTLTASSTGILNADVKTVKLCYSTTNAVSAAGVLNNSPVCSSNLWGSTVLSGGATPQSQAFSANVTGLTPGTDYYEQLQVVFYDDSVLNGAALLFTTASLQTATNSTVTGISSTSATLNGTVDAKGSTLSSVKFCYDTTTAFTNCAANTVTLSGPWTTGSNSISTALTGLTSSTTYYFKILTVSDAGSVESSYTSFKTLSVLSFDAQGGSSVSAVEYATGGTVNLTTKTTSQTGYTFLGWFEASTGGTAVSTSYAVPGTTDKTLYAHWSQDSYAITYDLHSGSLSGTPQATYVYGGTITNPGTPTRSGYTFAGWWTTATSGGSQYTFTHTTTGTGALTIHARWTLDTYTVYFDEHSGSSVNNATYSINGTISAPSPSTNRDGYRFDGWFTAATGGSLIDFTSYPSAGTTGDITLHAQWTAYTVTFSAGTGSGTVPSSTSGPVVLPGQGSMTAPGTATFGGWQCPTGTGTLAAGTTFNPTSNVTCTAVWILAGSKTVTFHKNFASSTDTTTQSTNTPTNLVANSFTVTGHNFAYWCKVVGSTCAVGDRVLDEASYDFLNDIDLYAIWTVASYTITFEPNLGTGTATGQSYNYGATNALSYSSGFTRNGYNLSGWSETPSGSVLASYTVTQSESLYAIWTLKSYTITYHNNFGTPTTATQTLNHFDTTALSFALPSGGNWTRNGYTFQGWSTSPSGSIASSYTVTGAANLYAVWQADSFTIVYDINDGSLSPSTVTNSFAYGATNALTYSTGFSRTGYTLDGWTDTSRSGAKLASYTVTTAATLYAKWIAGTNPVIFNKQNGTADISSSYLTGGTIADPNVTPVLAGNRFVGWFTLSSGGTQISSWPYAPGGVGTVTIYAQWTPFVVTFALGNGGGTAATGTPPSPMTGVIAHLPGRGSMVAPTNYVFTGWTCAGSPTVYLEDSSITPAGDITCTAVWTLNSAKTITFHSNYPIGNAATTTVQTSSSAANLNPNPFSSGGYRFIGWALSPTGTVQFADRASYDFLLDGNLYARWAQEEPSAPVFIINFEYQGGDGSIKVTYYQFGDPGVKLPEATRKGYNFTGWTLQPTETTPITGPFTTASNVKLFAQWTPKTVTITFNYQGGTTGIASMKYTVGEPGVTLPFGSIKGKLYFGGWADVVGGSNPVNEPFAPLEDITLFAIWNGTQMVVKLDPVTAPQIKLIYVVGGNPIILPKLTDPVLSFVGWNAATNAITGVVGPYKPTKSETLYPVWKEEPANTKVFFKGDSPVLTAAAKKILQNLAKKVYKSVQHRQLVVDGWVKETLNKSYDIALSDKRAANSAAYLRKLGVDAFARLTPRGISPENNDTSRRANISVFYSGPKKSK